VISRSRSGRSDPRFELVGLAALERDLRLAERSDYRLVDLLWIVRAALFERQSRSATTCASFVVQRSRLVEPGA